MDKQNSWIDLGSSVGYSKQVNSKKSIRLKNRTKYFDSSKDRSHVAFGSPNTYQFRQIKIEGYETRLYYEFLWCQNHNGQTFYYTLTYNDKNIPKYEGYNVFDYEDLRFLLNGGFKKYLLRNFGTNFRYFVGAELGDGQGKRGLHNNPHYHVLFFLRDAQDERYTYKKISPYFFRHLLRKYWQGFDEDVDGWHSYKLATFGILKEGDFVGLVSDFRAISYVSKYVTKDVNICKLEKSLPYRISQRFKLLYKDTEQSYLDFFRSELNSLFNIPLNVQKTDWLYSEKQLFKLFATRAEFQVPDVLFDSDEWMSVRTYLIKSTISYYSLWNSYYKFVDSKASEKVSEEIKVFRNRYSNKCRISQHVGEYALDFIDPLNPSVPIPGKNGIKHRPVGLYLYRKLYTDIYTDLDGNNYRFLNPRGIQYKVSTIERSVSSKAERIIGQVQSVLDNRRLFNDIIMSDVNVNVSLCFEHFKLLWSEALKDISLTELCKRYAEYKLVYEDRFFKVGLEKDGCTSSFPDINLSSDYSRFLRTSVGHVKRGNYRLDLFLENPPMDILPYFSHPYFLRYSCLFDFFDLLSDYFFVQDDDVRQKKAEEIAKVKRFHNARKMNQWINDKSHINLFDYGKFGFCSQEVL